MNRYTLPSIKLLMFSFFFILLSNNTYSQDQEYFTISLEILTDLSDDTIQTNNTNESSKKKVSSRYFRESADDKLTPKGSQLEEAIPSYFRHHKQLPDDFSGFVIELLQTDEKVERNYPLFERFGNIKVQQLDNGKYSYCIIVDFKSPNRVKIFTKEVILPNVPDAQALRYRKGKRKKM